MAKRVDPIKQREKRAKIAAAVGAVLFLIVAAFEVPTILKMMHPKPVVPPPTNVAAPDGSVPNAKPVTPSGVTASGQLADTDVLPADGSGQLVAFDVFQTKDPFRPQVTASADTGGSSAAATTPTTTTPAPTTTTPDGTTPPTAVPPTPPPGGVTTTPTTTTTTPAVPAQPLVTISVNGAVSRVATGGTFPSGTPVFRLVSWTKGEARVGIVGGSYATGDPTLSLRVGVPVTLQNTSNDQRYKLILVSTP
jgi:hypothetical protein